MSSSEEEKHEYIQHTHKQNPLFDMIPDRRTSRKVNSKEKIMKIFKEKNSS